MISIKSEKEIELIKKSCRIVALVHEEIKKNICEGMTTKQVDKIAEDVILKCGATPSSKNYPSGVAGVPNFPAATCISVNNEIIHGIPSDNRIIKSGDIVSVDVTACKNGYHGDAARTYVIGEASDTIKKLVRVTEESFFVGIDYAKKGCRIGDISYAIQRYVERNGFSVIREFQGHGIGKQMHEDPGIPNYGLPHHGPRIDANMTLAIEPMVCEKGFSIKEGKDGWTIYTKDGGYAAHYENTVLITEKEPEILTII